MRLLIALACFSSGFSRVLLTKLLRQVGIASIFYASSTNFVPQYAVADDLVQQLQSIKSENMERQRLSLAEQEEALMTKELTYPAGKLIARGVIQLSTEGLQASDFPFGLENAALIDPEFGVDKASMIVLAIGREGPPVAAKRFSLKDTTFPLVFEITTDDLLFPYNAEAWQESKLSKDTIAVTAILNSEGRLSSQNAVQRLGFATSDLTVFAGTKQRSSAGVVVSAKLDNKMYSADELQILSGIDDGLDNRGAALAAASTPKSGRKK
jgi:hypothetical protein